LSWKNFWVQFWIKFKIGEKLKISTMIGWSCISQMMFQLGFILFSRRYRTKFETKSNQGYLQKSILYNSIDSENLYKLYFQHNVRCLQM
jgi:hypothetical protein